MLISLTEAEQESLAQHRAKLDVEIANVRAARRLERNKNTYDNLGKRSGKRSQLCSYPRV